MYHSVGGTGTGETGAELYSVPVEKFREQLKMIKTWGHLPAGRQGHSKNGDSPQPLITFDDGLADNFTNAYPILKESGLKAYFFVMPQKIETKGYMGWEQLKELAASSMIIGSHGMTHKILTELSDTELDYELKESKKLLEAMLGTKVEYFSVPRGFCDKRVVSAAKKAGYRNIFTSNPDDNDGYCIGRIAVKDSWDIKRFSKIITRGLTLSDKIEDAIKNTLKRLLGAGIYDRIRAELLHRPPPDQWRAPRNDNT